jgi:DNA-binding phage protein
MANLINQKENLKSIPEEQFSKYDVADHLTSRVEIAAYLEAAKEENDPSLLAAVMEDIRQIETVQHASKTRILP